MTIPGAAGVRVATGRLRVDAARAVDKLRDYQLPDPTMWVLEVVRAAVLAGAERVRVHGDADDVWIAWDGPALDPSDLVALFDDLVDPAPPPERRHLRLLATGINTALGLGPRWVDVYSCGERARVVRYTPKLLERDADGAASRLRTLAPRIASPRTPIAPREGGLVHLRRLPLLGAVLIGLGEPPELGVARRSCADLSVPIEIGRTELGRDRSHRDLVRVPLGQGLDGFLAIVDPSFAEDEARLEIAELGVLLARYTLPIDGLAEKRARVPIRLFVDAPRMPTNASRSEVRLDEAPVADALGRARELLPSLIAAMARELAAGRKTSPLQRERLRVAALSLIAAGVAGSRWRVLLASARSWGVYGTAIVPLLAMPLVRDAIGRPRALASFAPHVGHERVHTGVEPVPEDLATWLGDVLWISPGDASSVLLGRWIPPSAKPLIKSARHARKARDAWLKRSAAPAEIPAAPGQLLAVPLRAPGVSVGSAMPASYFARDVEGELVLCDLRARRGGSVSMRSEGRELELVRFDSPLAFSAFVESAFAPEPSFRRVVRDAAFERAMSSVQAASVVACEALALELAGKKKPGARATMRAKTSLDDEATCALLRAAIAHAARMLASDEDSLRPDVRLRAGVRRLRATKSPLLDAKIWPTAWGERLSMRDILAACEEHRAIGRSSVRASGAPRPTMRPILRLDAREAELVSMFLEPAPLVDYTHALASSPRDSFYSPGAVSLALNGERWRASISWSGHESALEIRHCGRVVERGTPAGTLAPCRVIVDDDRLVPNATWSAPAVPVSYPFSEWERALARAYADALAGSPPAELSLGTSALTAASALFALFDVLRGAPEDPRAWLGAERLAKLKAARIVGLLGESERVSLDEVARRFPKGPIPWVATSETASAGDWHPIRAAQIEAQAYARVLGRELVHSHEELARARARDQRREALERHRRRTPETPPSAPFIALDVKGAISAHATFGVGLVDVRIEGRSFARVSELGELPVYAIVDLPETAADETFTKLTPHAQAIVAHARGRGARALLRETADESPEHLFSSPAFDLLSAWARELAIAPSDEELRKRIAGARAYRTVQGELVALADARRGAALWIAEWDEPWLGPDGDPSPYDRPILRVGKDRGALERRVLEELSVAKLEDVTAAVMRQQSERRVARGLERAPYLARVSDPRFRFALTELLAKAPEALGVLGIGEAALAEDSASRLFLFVRGQHVRTLDLNLIPRVHVAAESPLVRAHDIGPAEGTRLHDALRTVIAHLVRRVIDDTPKEQLPIWVRRSLRASALAGGPPHFEAMADVPMFETTTGAWLTPRDLLAQRDRFGDLWWVDAPLDHQPLDPARVAIVISSAEALHLAPFVRATHAVRELELDARARANRDRPPVSLDPTPEERAAAWHTVELAGEDGMTRGSVTLLSPGASHLRGMRLHKNGRPFDADEDPSSWPCSARIEHAGLTPDRTWDRAVQDTAWITVRNRVRNLVDRELTRLVPFPARKDGAIRVRTQHSKELGLAEGAPLEGVAWIERGERLIAHTRRGQEDWTAEDIPLAGRLCLDQPIEGFACITFARALFVRTLARLVTDVGPAPLLDDPRALTLLEHVRLLPSTPSISLPCFAPGRVLLSTVLAVGARFSAAPPEEVDVARDALGEGDPVLVLGSAMAERVAALATVVPWKTVVRISAPPAPTPDPPLAPPPKLRPIEQMLSARLAAVGASGVRVSVAARRKKPFVTSSLGALELAGRHPIVVRVEQAIELRDPALDALLDLVTARLAGHLARTSTYFTSKAELDVAIELLRS